MKIAVVTMIMKTFSNTAILPHKGPRICYVMFHNRKSKRVSIFYFAAFAN